MVKRCLSLLLALSVALVGLLAATGEGPLLEVKERQVLQLGANNDLPTAGPVRDRLAMLARGAAGSR